MTVLGGTALSLAFLGYASPALAAPPAPAAAPSAAPAAGPDAATKKTAREAYGAGEKAYSAGDYKTAFTNFKKAHDLIPTIHAEYWMAMAQSYDDTQTAAAYDALSAVVASPDASKLGEEKLGAATGRLTELKKTPASVSVTTTPPGAEVSVDGAAQPGVTPTTISLPAGSHHLAIGLKGYDAYETDIVVKPGQKAEQAAELKKTAEMAAIPAPPPPLPPETPAAPPPPKEPPSKIPAYVTLGVGVVGAGVGTIFGIQALNAKSEFDKHPTNSNADKAERDALIADMGFAVALTLGITGIVLLTTGDDGTSEVTAHETHKKQPARARLDVAPVISPTTQGAAARLTF